MTAVPGTSSVLPVGAPDTSDAGARAGAPQQQHAPLSLKANFSWTLAGNVAYAACQWAMLVVLAKLGTAEKVGQFVLGLAVTAPVMLFSSLKLRSVQATDARREFRFGDYFALRLVCTTLAVATIATIAAAGGYGRQTALVILAVGAAKALESVSDILHGLFQQHERMDWIARSLTLKGVLSLAALAVTFYLTKSVAQAALAMAAAFAAVLLVFDLPVSAKVLRGSAAAAPGPLPSLPALAYQPQAAGLFRPRWHGPTMWALFLMAAPLGVAVAANSLGTNVPRYFLAATWGERDLGIFGALASPMAAGVIIINALGQSAAPRLARYHATGARAAFDATLRKMIGVGALLGAAGLALAWVAGRKVLLLLFKPEYAQHLDVFLWLVGAAALQYTYIFLGSAINAMRCFGIQLPLNVVNPLASAVACAVLVPRFGLVGAAWAVVVGTVCEGVAHVVLFLYVRSRHRAAVGPAPGGG